MTPEGKVKDAVKRIFKRRDIWYYMPVQNGMGVTGIPDFVCCWNGRFLGVETKAPGKKPTSNQERVGTEIITHGGSWICVSSADELEAFFNSQGDDLRTAVWDATHPKPGAKIQ